MDGGALGSGVDAAAVLMRAACAVRELLAARAISSVFFLLRSRCCSEGPAYFLGLGRRSASPGAWGPVLAHPCGEVHGACGAVVSWEARVRGALFEEAAHLDSCYRQEEVFFAELELGAGSDTPMTCRST